jgi:teichuronic acid biosynthesis glycosyltransferase TuaH
MLMMHTTEKLKTEGLRTRDAHFLEALDAHPRVSRILVVDRPATRAERILQRRAGRSEREAIMSELGLRKTELLAAESTAIVRPLYLRSQWWRCAFEPANLTAASLIEINRAMHHADAALCFVPTAHALWADRVPTVFDLLDNWLVHPQLGARNDARFEMHYRRSFDRAGWITANSEGTAELAARFGRSATVVPNGVDLELFQHRARATAAAWQERLNGLPRPWRVYAGKMQERVDVELLAELSKQRDGSLILAGPVLSKKWMQPIAEMSGVTWLNDVPYAELPGLLAVADVALIPHRVGEGEVAGDPLKAQEYVAVGARFVSTSITGAERIRGRGVVADSPRAFIASVLELGRDDRSLDERFKASLSSPEDSWRAKADAVLRLIESGEDSR